MNAGREVDALVAEKVMGWLRARERWNTKLMVPPPGYEFTRGAVSFVGILHTDVPRYSTDIAAAWTVVEKLIERFVLGRWHFRAESHGTFDAEFWTMEEDGSWSCLAEEDDHATMPLAICRAALAAVGAEVPA